MTDRFTGETGIAIDMQTLGWDDIRTKIVTSTLAGSAPADVTEVDWSWVGQFGAAGWYEPLDGVVSAALRQDAPTEKIFTFDGKLIAMPYNNDYRVLILNAAQTKKAGIDKAPTTLDDLMADAKTVKAKAGVTYPIGLPLSATEGSATAWYLLTKAFGGELFDHDFKPLFTTKDSAGYKALAWEAEAVKAGLVDPASTGLKDVRHPGTLQERADHVRCGRLGRQPRALQRQGQVEGRRQRGRGPDAERHGQEPHLRAPGRRRDPQGLDPQGGGRRLHQLAAAARKPDRMLHGARQPADQDPPCSTRSTRAGKLAGGKVLIRGSSLGGAAVRPGDSGLVPAVLERPPRQPSTRWPKARCRSTMPSRRSRREPRKP